MTKTWVTADLHLGHHNIIRYANRPFANLDEMHGALIRNWNDRVGERDRIYVLGDLAMRKRSLELLRGLKGRKVLVRGNHDCEKLNIYREYFDDVRGIVVKKGFVLTHVPIHPACMDRWGINIHGHLHEKSLDDPRYICVSVEQTNYAPVEIGELLNGRN